MAGSNGFQFKQFFVSHDKCAMKVNTDGILLGAIADPNHAGSILDLGTGTGLVALMLAQRSTAHITAIELEPNAYLQAVENGKNSPFSDRLQIIQHDVRTLQLEQKFDLIVSNPPYFEHSLASRDQQRDLARAITNSHLDWLNQAEKHLSESGKISFILPTEMAEKLVVQAQQLGLNLIERWSICTKIGKLPKRQILTFSRSVLPCLEKSLAIYTSENQYTDEFKQLTRDFYLNF